MEPNVLYWYDTDLRWWERWGKTIG